MSKKGKVAAVSSGIIVLAAAAFLALGNRAGIPLIEGVFEEPPRCELSGTDAPSENLAARPSVGIKVTNDRNAYPLSGLEDAEIVFEELIEGGSTRFMAIYHCTDADKIGPVRSARSVDPAIMTPLTRILGYSGENAHVLAALESANIVRVTEDMPGEALVRFPRTGYSFEHTLYTSSRAVRKIGRRAHSEPPPRDTLSFGDLPERSRRAANVSIAFSGLTQVRWDWDGERWLRSQGGVPFVTELGEQISADNVLVEEHRIEFSETVFDAAGNPSVEIADPTGSGRAVLFRDGRAIVGRWERESVESAVRFVTRAGDEMLLKPGTTWVALVPSDAGDVKGSYSFERE